MRQSPNGGRIPSVRIPSSAHARPPWVALLVAAVLLACGDPVSPPVPASLAVVSGADQEGAVTDSLAAPLSVRVVDSNDRPVPSTLVRWAVTAGGGDLSRDSVPSDAAGLSQVRWVLGDEAGEQTVTASVAGVPTVTFRATARPGPAARLTAQAPPQQSAEVGTDVPQAPAVMAVDAFGNAVADVSVSFAVTEGDGSVESTSVATGTDGVAQAGSWTLGTAAGANAVRASAPIPGASSVITFRATGTAGAAMAMAIHEGADQIAAVGDPVPVAPAVLLTDRFGNPVVGVAVEFAVTQGGGGVIQPVVDSDEAGIARVGAWNLGPAPGVNGLRATAGDLPPVDFVADGRDATINLSVRSVHLNQGNQTVDAGFGAVAGRPGILRVMLDSNETHDWAPFVRVRLYEGATLVRDTVLPPTTAGIQSDPDPGQRDHTWNLRLEADEVVEGLAVAVTVDPDDTISETDESDNDYPEIDPASLGVRTLAPLRLVVLPIEATTNGTTSDVNAGNIESLLTSTRGMLPVEDIESTIRTPFSTTEDLSTPGGWSTLLSDLQALRTAEGAADEYYHGIIRQFSGIAYGGLAYVPGSNASGFRTALSVENADVIVHELGHNLGRPHSPCGGAGGPDPGYPHPDAALGGPGYDVATDALLSDPAYRDFMSYCGPEWTSDYTFQRILDWRTDDPRVPAGMSAAASRTPVRGVLLWGRTGPGGVVLNPALEIEAPVPASGSAFGAPSGAGAGAVGGASGRHEVRGFDADGAVVFRVSVDAVPVADGDDPDETHFATFVPLGAGALEALRRVELRTPLGTAERTAAAARAGEGGAAADAGQPEAGAADAEATVRVLPAGPGVVRLAWDAERHPIALVRDATSGDIVSFARGGDVVVRYRSDPANLLVHLSDGVRTRSATPR